MTFLSRLRAYVRGDPTRLQQYRQMRKAKCRKSKRDQKCQWCRAAKSDASQKIVQKNEDSHLMKLPPELRNLIWEFAVAESPELIVDAQLNPPSWLATSRQVRQEALSLWYLTNAFRVDVYDLDVRILTAWYRHVYKIGLWAKMERQVKIQFKGLPNWQNLLNWAKAVWGQSRVLTPPKYDDPTVLEAVAYTAISIAVQSRGLPWEHCERALEDFHYTVVNFDERWELGEEEFEQDSDRS